MAITFNTNLSALTSQRYLGIAGDKTASSLAKLSSGSRVPTAKDDAAALAVGSKLRAEVAGLNTAANNASQAVSLLQIADGALSTVGDILVRMKALAVQSSSGQLSDTERGLLNQEYSNLRTEIDRIAQVTNFNGTQLLSGSTTVTSNINNINLAGTAANGYGGSLASVATAGSGENLIRGVDEVRFGTSVTAAAFALEYDAAGKTFKATNLSTGQTQTVTLADAAIAAGATESVSFNNLGVTVVLNDQFDKSESTSIANGVRTATYTEVSDTGTNVANGSWEISEYRLKAASGITVQDFDGVTVSISAGTATVSTATATVAGQAFSVKGTNGLPGGTFDLSTAGAKTVTLIDAAGNEFDVSFTATDAFTNGDTASFSVVANGINSSLVDIDDANLLSSLTTGNQTITRSGTSTGVVAASSVTVTNADFSGSGALRIQNLDGAVFNVTVNAADSSTTVAVSNLLNDDGTDVGGNFYLDYIDANTTANQINTSAKTLVIRDNDGNSFRLNYEVTGATLDNGDQVAITLDAKTALAGTAINPAVDNESVKLIGVSKGSASTFDFGTIDDTTVSWTAGNANAATLDLVVNGTTFRATNVDLSIAGLKTVELLQLDSGGTALSGTSRTSISVQFNVTGGFANGGALNLEVGQLGQIVGANAQVGTSTEFAFKVGTGTTTNDSISFALSSATTAQLGINTSDVSTAANADLAIDALNNAINAVSSQRADIGANQSRLDFASASIAVAIENTTAAQSGLLDVDVSAEITEFTSQQVLLQAGVSLLAQANQQPALLLRLLQ